MKNLIRKMYEYCFESLKIFGDEDIIDRMKGRCDEIDRIDREEK